MAHDETTVGVDFATDGVHLAAVDIDADGPRVVATHTYRWPRGSWADGTIHSRTVVREGLRQAFEEAELPTDRVALGIGGDDTLKIIEVPAMTDAELAEQIQWESEQHVPGDIADMQLEYRVASRPAGEAMSVVLVGLPRDKIDSHLAVARDAGLRPRSVDSETEALRRLLETTHASREPVGDEARAIALVRATSDGGRIVIARAGEAAFSKQIEAVTAEDGAAGVTRAVEFFAATDDGDAVAEILIAGPDAKPWAKLLRQRSSTPVAAWHWGQLRRGRGDGPDHEPGEPGGVGPYATAIGLALPGPRTHPVGGAPPQPGLLDRLVRFFGGRAQ